MTRQIKFRVWDGHTNSYMHKDKETHYLPTVEVDEDTGELSLVAKDERYDIQLCTGLKDMHGKEVYEGDIVQYDHRYLCLTYKEWDDGKRWADVEKETNWDKRCSKVEYDRGGFTLEYPLHFNRVYGGIEGIDGICLQSYREEKDRYPGESVEEWRNFEVIGNIYENPELLKTPTK